jgi:methyl-accepting chemotaxis protein
MKELKVALKEIARNVSEASQRLEEMNDIDDRLEEVRQELAELNTNLEQNMDFSELEEIAEATTDISDSLEVVETLFMYPPEDLEPPEPEEGDQND